MPLGRADSDEVDDALRVVMERGPDAARAAAYERIAGALRPDRMACSTLAYNLACWASGLRRKADVLAWIAAALRLGEDAAELAADPDLHRYRESPDVVALLGIEPPVPRRYRTARP